MRIISSEPLLDVVTIVVVIVLEHSARCQNRKHSPSSCLAIQMQEVARMLEDQVRSHQELIKCTLREVDEKYSEKEKAINEKLDNVNTKLTSALAEITAKDNLVKQHIKVAEEAVIGKLKISRTTFIKLSNLKQHIISSIGISFGDSVRVKIVSFGGPLFRMGESGE